MTAKLNTSAWYARTKEESKIFNWKLVSAEFNAEMNGTNVIKL